MLVRVGCGIAEIDAVTVPAKPADVAEPDSEISYTILTIDPVALRSVRTRTGNNEVFDQYLAVLIAVSQLERCWRVGIDRAEIETFSIGAFNAKIAKYEIRRRSRDNLRSR